MSEMKERMHTGELYLPGDDEIMKQQSCSAKSLTQASCCISRKRMRVGGKAPLPAPIRTAFAGLILAACTFSLFST